MKRVNALLGILLIVLYLVFSVIIANQNRMHESSNDYDIALEETARLRVNQSHIAEVVYQQGMRNSDPCRISVSKRILYVTYGQEDYIDAYNEEGQFVYTILVPQYPNGMVDICTHADRLFIFSKSGDVYIMESPENLQYLPRKEAIQSGYSTGWCSECQRNQVLEVGKEFITYRGNDDKNSIQFVTPDIIVKYLEKPKLPRDAMILLIVIFSLAFLAVVVILIIKRVKKVEDGQGMLSCPHLPDNFEQN